MKQDRWDSRNWQRDSSRLLNIDLKDLSKSPKKIKKKRKIKKKDDFHE